MILEGKCWKIGDDIPIDGALLELKYVHMRLTNPHEIAQFVLESYKPGFSEKCKPGDILVAGKRFAQGNAHIQAFRGMFGLGIGVASEWITRGGYRNCVIAGVPFLPKCPGISEMCLEGDILKVNFENGLFENLTQGKSITFDPLPIQLLEIVKKGGSTQYWKEIINQKNQV